MKSVGTLSAKGEYKSIKADYAFNPDVMSEDTQRVRMLKRVIDRLPMTEKTLLLMYVDCGSYRKLGKKMRVDHVTLYYRIRPIIAKVRSQMERIENGKND